MTTAFEFIGDVQMEASMRSAGGFVINVPAGLRSKSELMDVLASAGNFPDYFGRNWDALSDCLRDFSWIRDQKIVIAHSDIPLCDKPTEARIYLEILRDAVADWAPLSESQNGLSAVGHEDKKLRVLFPEADRGRAAEILG